MADSNPQTGDSPDRQYPGTPTWVKAFVVVIATVVVVAVLVLVVGTALGLHSPMPGGHGG
jgi:hypothetical protein